MAQDHGRNNAGVSRAHNTAVLWALCRLGCLQQEATTAETSNANPQEVVREGQTSVTSCATALRQGWVMVLGTTGNRAVRYEDYLSGLTIRLGALPRLAQRDTGRYRVIFHLCATPWQHLESLSSSVVVPEKTGLPLPPRCRIDQPGGYSLNISTDSWAERGEARTVLLGQDLCYR